MQEYFITIAAMAGAITTLAEIIKNLFGLHDTLLFRIFGKSITVMFTIVVILTIIGTYIGTLNHWGIFAGNTTIEVLSNGLMVLLTALGAHSLFLRKAKIK